MLEKLLALLARFLARGAGIYLLRVAVRPLSGFARSPGGRAVACRLLRDAEVELWTSDRTLELARDMVHAALARGDVCVGAFDGDRLVGYEWIAFGSTPHVAGLWVEFRASDCYIYRKFVHPDYRGLGIASLLDAEANRIAARHNRERVICCIDLNNSASWRSALRTGGRRAGYVGYLACFGRLLPFRSAGALAQGLRFYDARASASQPLPKAA